MIPVLHIVSARNGEANGPSSMGFSIRCSMCSGPMVYLADQFAVRSFLGQRRDSAGLTVEHQEKVYGYAQNDF
jgi:hypothetical protein